jgi:hypothetical protein
VKRLLLAIVRIFSLALIFALALPVTSQAGTVQATNLACSDGSSVILSLDTATLTGLISSVAAINANGLDLSCSLSPVDSLTLASDTAHGKHDFGVGGVTFFASSCFQGTVSFSGHSDAEQPTVGVQGTIDETLNGTCVGHYKASIYCVLVEANTVDMIGNVQGTATGIFSGDQAFELTAEDSGSNAPEFFNTNPVPPGTPCIGRQDHTVLALTGNITVHDAAVT